MEYKSSNESKNGNKNHLHVSCQQQQQQKNIGKILKYAKLIDFYKVFGFCEQQIVRSNPHFQTFYSFPLPQSAARR